MNSELKACFRRVSGSFTAVALLSGFSNLLSLTGSIFMLAVYDRVIPSGSVQTLIALGLLCLAAYGIQGLVDICRGRILTRIGLVMKEALSARVYDITVRNAVGGNFRSGAAARDLDQVSGFLASMGPTALFDLPWLPIYLFMCFAFHFYIGLVVAVGALLLIAITLIGNALAKRPIEALNEASNRQNALLNASQSQAETLHSMGMTINLSTRWNRLGQAMSRANRALADTTTTLGTVSRVARMVLQSVVLAVGAFLVIHGDATGGIMIASSILSARALAPIELAIGHWKNFATARQSWGRLDKLFTDNPADIHGFKPPLPTTELACEGLTLALASERRIIVRDINLTLSAGDALAIVGPTGSGKSTLARGLVGLWPPAAGAVRLDGLAISDWSPTERGRFVGYLPQNCMLFEGTIAENISRFAPGADSDEIVAVARAAGVHDLISRLPEGYETRIAEGGVGLSGGQSQRIGFARALYGNPFLVVLDEPNSNLDNDGDLALAEALEAVRARKGIAVVVTHRTNVLQMMSHMLVLRDGIAIKYGRRDDVVKFLQERQQPVARTSAAA